MCYYLNCLWDLKKLFNIKNYVSFGENYLLNYFAFVTFAFKVCDSKKYICKSNSISRVSVLVIKYHALGGKNYKEIWDCLL